MPARRRKLCRVLTDRGTEYCGTHDRHEYELYLAVENIDHTRTKAKSPQTTDVIDKCFLAGSELFSSRRHRNARISVRRRAERLEPVLLEDRGCPATPDRHAARR
jgi:hypothetical protein